MVKVGPLLNRNNKYILSGYADQDVKEYGGLTEIFIRTLVCVQHFYETLNQKLCYKTYIALRCKMQEGSPRYKKCKVEVQS